MARCFNCMRIYPSGKKFCPYCGYAQQSSEDDQYYLPRGTLLSSERYFIGVPVNMGGFGIVYKAWDQTLSKLVAIKEYFPGGVAARTPGGSSVFVYSKKRQEDFLKGKQRFLDEARRIAKFNRHPNIVDVYDYFEDNHTAYMVMEYMSGLTYKQYVKSQGGRLNQQLAVTVALAILNALSDIHKEKIIHRDINPNNIFICDNGVIKLFDFGAARMEETEMSTILTPGYAPPEQYSSGIDQGPYTDIYAVGATTWFALTGEKPEESSDRVQEDILQSPRDLFPEISPVVSNAVMKAMALKPEYRFQTADEFRRALLNKKPVQDIRTQIRRRKRRQIFLAVCFVVIFLTAVGALSWGFHSQMAAGTLRPAQLEIWLVSDENDTESSVRERFETMSAAFTSEYDQISFDIRVYSEGEYEQKINKAAAEGNLPDLFETDLLYPEYYPLLKELDQTLELLNDLSAYRYLDQYQKLFPEHRQMPLCFQLPVIYVRQDTGSKSDGTTAFNKKDLLLYQKDFSSDTDKDSVADQGETIFFADADLFCNGDIDRYCSDTSDYQFLNESLPGQYRIELPDTNGWEETARFDHVFAVGTDGEAGKAAQWLLSYLLSAGAQETLCVLNGEGIPLYHSECEAFFDVYGGELEELDSQIPSSIGGSAWLEESLNYQNQYKGGNP